MEDHISLIVTCLIVLLLFLIIRHVMRKRLSELVEEESTEVRAPHSSKQVVSNKIPQDRRPVKTDVTNNNTIVKVGDTVMYVDMKNPTTKKQVRISLKESNPELEMINIDTPVARSLLGACIGDEVEVNLPKGTKQMRIEQIIKN